jgi:hypothetical protein
MKKFKIDDAEVCEDDNDNEVDDDQARRIEADDNDNPKPAETCKLDEGTCKEEELAKETNNVSRTKPR